MNFGDALAAAKTGKTIQRAGWNGKGMFVFLCSKACFEHVIFAPGTNCFEHVIFAPGTIAPFLAMKPVIGPFVPWLASQTDILAEDWSVIS